VNLAWTAATDNVSVATYEIYRDGSLIATKSHPLVTHADTGLNPDSTYTYEVMAKDAAGNASAKSSAVTVLMPPAGVAPAPAPQPQPQPAPAPVVKKDDGKKGGGGGGGSSKKKKKKSKSFSKDLSINSTGKDVTKLEQLLAARGLMYRGYVDGHYSMNTARGVRLLQRRYGLPQTGVLDARTRTLVKNILKGKVK
jgi:peptidoglycan hydrolase-like protein with peptidoglycan-binding domain